MKLSKTVSGVLAFTIVMASCQNVEFKKTSAGIPYKVFASKKGDSVRVGSVVKYYVVQKVKDSVFYSSYKNNRPEFFEVQPPLGEKSEYLNIKANAEEVIRKAKEGDSLYLVQSTDSLLKNPAYETVLKKGEQMVTTIKIDRVYKNVDEARTESIKEEAVNYDANKQKGLESFKKDTASQVLIQKDVQVIENYLNSKNIKAEKSEWGIFIERLAPGQGPKPGFGQYSNVRYKGMHLAGGVFDEGTMPVQVGISQVVFGFMEGVSQLRKGEKARIYMPSLLAYGEQGSPPKIEPNEILVFEIEVLDITNEAPAPSNMQPQGQ